MMHCTCWCIGILWLAATATVAGAQDCVLPGPFQHQFQNNVTATLSAANPEDPCALSVALNAGAGPAAAGFLHYRRLTPTTSVRYGFRVDTSALANFASTNVLRNFLLFSASSPVVITSPISWSHVLRLSFAGGNPNPIFTLYAARGLDKLPPVIGVSIPVTQALNTLRIEINVGAGSAGSVRYWLNAPFSDPPTGTLDDGGVGLDNAAWIGVIAAEVGVSSPSYQFRNEFSDSAVVLDQIESSEDLLTWSDFETVQ
jgi:hypothetical protein